MAINRGSLNMTCNSSLPIVFLEIHTSFSLKLTVDWRKWQIETMPSSCRKYKHWMSSVCAVWRDEEQVDLMRMPAPGRWGSLFQIWRKEKGHVIAGVFRMNAWMVKGVMGIPSGEWILRFPRLLLLAVFGQTKAVQLDVIPIGAVSGWKDRWGRLSRRSTWTWPHLRIFLMVSDYKLHFLLGGFWGGWRGTLVPADVAEGQV